MDGGPEGEGADPQPDHVRFLFDARASLGTWAEQRRRFASSAATLGRPELAAPSRCEGWSVADVLRHLIWVDTTMRAIWSGTPSLAKGFDPRTTPRESVEADRAIPDEIVRDRYVASTEDMVADLEGAETDRFGQPSVSPLGLVPWWLSAVHIGWDSSIHERDALLPLGMPIAASPAEESLALAYSLVMTSFFCGKEPLDMEVGPIRLRRQDGPVRVWDAGEDPGDDSADSIMLTGTPAASADALCGRGAMAASFTGDGAVIERLGGLARYFASA